MIVSRGLIWPILLIAAGIAFMLGNLGYLPPFDIGRAISRLWPLLLIMLGLDLAFSRRSPGLALALQVAVVVAAVGLVAAQPALIQPRAGFVGDSSAEVATDGATSASLRFNFGGGRFELEGGATERTLLFAESEEPDLRVETDRDGDRIDVRLDQEHEHFNTGPTDLRVRVARDVPMSIRLDAGAGELRLDLSDVKVTDVRISAGASSLTLVLSRPTGDVPVRIQAGASSIVIEVPTGVEAKITASGALINTSGRTETPGYAAATDRVTVTVEAGASSISVR